MLWHNYKSIYDLWERVVRREEKNLRHPKVLIIYRDVGTSSKEENGHRVFNPTINLTQEVWFLAGKIMKSPSK